MKFSSGLTKFSPYVRAERTETTCPLSKYVRDGVVKQCFQPLSPSDRAFAGETEDSECGYFFFVWNIRDLVHLFKKRQ
jgi:hypothetical protein